MGYAIVGGVGLAVGLALMIWALTERSKRAAAERKAQEADTLRESAERIASTNATVVATVNAEKQRLLSEVTVLQDTLDSFRKRLEACADPQAVKDWLDELGKGGPV